MNKIYSDQIEKARTLVEGLKKNLEFLKTKGYDASIIAKLEDDCAQMEKEGAELEKLSAIVANQRNKCHTILNILKDDLQTGKSGIKSRFDQEKWILYGVTDKR